MQLGDYVQTTRKIWLLNRPSILQGARGEIVEKGSDGWGMVNFYHLHSGMEYVHETDFAIIVKGDTA
jgi:hypothetical protein